MLLLLQLALAQAPPTLQQARIDLPVGHVLRAADLQSLSLPDRDVPLGTVREAQSVIGRVVKVPIFRGELLRGEYLGDIQTVPSSLVPEGHWAFLADIRSEADDLDLVVLHAGGFCAAARGVHVVLRDHDLVSVDAGQVPRALAALAGEASVRRADPGLRDCR